jgi:hypothetical protein
MKFPASVLCALALAACADDSTKEPPFVDVDGDGVNDNDPTALRNFTLRFENVAPFTVLKASVQTQRPDKTDGPLGPGEVYEIRFSAGLDHRLTLAASLRESNDWFFGTDPAGIPLYVNGQPITGDITSQLSLWDAGTEYDEEPGVGPNTGLNQPTPTSGTADPDHRVRLVGDIATLSNGTAYVRPAINSMIRVTIAPAGTATDRMFLLRIENVSTTQTLPTSAGSRAITVGNTLWAIHELPNVLFDANTAPRDNGLDALAEAGNAWTLNNNLRLSRGVATPLSRGVLVVHATGTPLFLLGGPDSHLGLERIAEDGDPATLAASLQQKLIVEAESYKTFDAPTKSTLEGPCMAGDAFEVNFQARPGDRLSLATGFSSSNDWFIAPPAEGMELFNGNLPRWGEITTEFHLFDLGTEGDQELDVGPSVGTQQLAPNTGAADNNKNVREVGRDRYDVPLTHHIRVTLTPPQK